jgi:dynein heavy chain
VDLRKILIEVNYWNKVQQHGFVNLHINLTKLHHRRENLRILQENVMLIVRDYNHIMNLINEKEKLLFQEHLKFLDKDIMTGLKRLQWVNNCEPFVMQCRGKCRDTLRKIKSF